MAKPSANSITSAPVARIFLGLTNPRHEPVETEAQAISRLCDKENVYPLARDIVAHGVNPLELLGVVPRKNSTGRDQNYIAAEGNRRLCALKLLNDPELAPASLRKSFETLAADWDTPITEIPVVIFKDMDAVRIWLDRIHNGAQGGIGRKDWNSEQKQRFDGGNKNRAAQALLDYAAKEGMISAEDREGKLTTVQRFLGNEVFREALGFDAGASDQVGRTRPKTEFDILLRRFVRDLVGKTNVTSRMNKSEIVAYARPFASTPGVTTLRVEPEPLSITAVGKLQPRPASPKKPKKPEKRRFVQFDNEVFDALKAFGNEKLQSLYHSICTIELDPHTPIIAVGAWAFWESLTACAGRNENTSFDSFLSNAKLRSYGLAGELVTVRDVINRLRSYGNTTKHHAVSATFNGDQLSNDMATMRAIILKCVEEAANKPLAGSGRP